MRSTNPHPPVNQLAGQLPDENEKMRHNNTIPVPFEREEKPSEEDYRNADRVAAWSHLSKLTKENRAKLAQSLGENWACVMSGLGDQ